MASKLQLVSIVPCPKNSQDSALCMVPRIPFCSNMLTDAPSVPPPTRIGFSSTPSTLAWSSISSFQAFSVHLRDTQSTRQYLLQMVLELRKTLCRTEFPHLSYPSCSTKSPPVHPQPYQHQPIPTSINQSIHKETTERSQWQDPHEIVTLCFSYIMSEILGRIFVL